jgi:hypothetical protein
MNTSRLILGVICFCGAVYGQMVEMPVPTVAGHPFSADEVTSPQLSSKLSSAAPDTFRVSRDSAGRVRIDGPVSATRVVITDPVAGFKYVLNADTKIARRSTIAAQPPPTTDDPWKVQKWRMIVPGVVEASTKFEPLGTQLIGGLPVEGRRITGAFPKTERGAAEEDVSENWYSPELQMMLLRHAHYTSSGENTTRLENIDRSEPDPLMFQVPSDYTIDDGPLKHDNRP